MSDRPLAGKVVVITDAAQGQGAAQAAACAAEGATVIALDIRPADGVRAHDVASEQDWAALRDGLAAEFGEVHGLVNNAGITHRARLLDVQLADLQRVLAVNLAGPLLGIQAIAPLMPAGGSIVNIGSVAALTAHYPVATPRASGRCAACPRSPRWSWARGGSGSTPSIPGSSRRP